MFSIALRQTIPRLTIISNSGIVLEKVAEYFCYSHKHRNSENVPDMEIPPELCLELLMAADYLDSQSPIAIPRSHYDQHSC